MSPWSPLFAAALVGILAGPCAVGAEEPIPGEAFGTQVAPFLEANCTKCHDEEKRKGKVRLDDLEGRIGEEVDLARWKLVLEMLASGEMPPNEEKQPSKQERAKMVAWIKGGLEAAGHGSEWERKLLYPEYGNHIDHEQLFDGSVLEAAWSPSRLWKRSPHIFDAMLVRGIGLGQGRSGRPNGHLAKLKQPFTIEDKAGIVDFAAIAYADSATLGTLMRNAEVIVDKHLGGAMQEMHVKVHGEIPEEQLPKDKKGKPIRPRFPKTPAAFREIILSESESEPQDAQMEAAIRKMFELVIEREPSTDQLDKYRSLMRKCMGEGGRTEGLRTTLVAIAISPEAIYRAELGQGAVDEHGRQMLGPVDLAYAIAYALTDDHPDVFLLEAATTGRLANREDVAREVTRIWDDAEIAKPRILRFFHEFFGYHNAPKVFKDQSRFGKDYRNVPEKLVADADVLVNHIVGQDREVLVELLTTEKYFVAHSGDNAQEKDTNERIRKFYDYFKELEWKDFPYATPKEHGDYARSIGRMFAHPNGNVVKGWMKYLTKCDENGVNPVPMQNGREFLAAYDLDEATFDYPVHQPFVLAKGKRAGILMHPAWLLAHSLNLDNDPVRRGKWVRERLLAGTVPEIPITVDARIPEIPDKTLRERFEVIRNDSYCWRCHVRMNPLGMPFESFDDFGRHRTEEVLQAKGKTAPVDSSGILEGTGDSSLDGEVENPIELVQRLAKSERVRQSFVRHAFRYWMGRNEMQSDASVLIAADEAYVEHGGSFRALVISLLTSDSFLYRKSFD